MKLLFKYLKPYTGKLILCFIGMILFALISGFSLSVLSPFLNAIFGGRGLINQTPTFAQNDLLAKLNTFFLKKSPSNCILLVSVTIVLVFFIKGIIGYIHKYLAAGVEERVMRNIRNDVYSHIHMLSMDYFHQIESGVLVSRITNDVLQIRDSIKEGFLLFVRELLLVLAYLMLALYLSWRLLLVSAIIFPFVFFLVNYLGHKLRKRSERVQKDMGKITSTLSESLFGMKIIKAFSMQEFELKKFFKTTFNYCRASLRFERVSLFGVPSTEFLTAIGICIILLYGGHEIFVLQTLSPDKFLVFLACAVAMFQPLKMLSRGNVNIQRGLKAMERVKSILDTKPSIVEKKNAVSINNFEKEIVFKDVSFKYRDKNVPPTENIIDEINLHIEKGERVALVGPSGGGKTTLTDLLLRFYDTSSGTIEIDGIDIKDIKIDGLRNLVGLVNQEPILFNDTIFNNIAYGIENAKKEDVYYAAEMANADEFINKLPDKYDTVIGEKGVRLSGGERQRLTIARALFKNPEILIFDEATSHLDSESEKKVQEAILRLLKERTSIIIAHRLSTVRNVDRIIVIDNGQIVEQGSHEQLVTKQGVYKKLVDKFYEK